MISMNLISDGISANNDVFSGVISSLSEKHLLSLINNQFTADQFFTLEELAVEDGRHVDMHHEEDEYIVNNSVMRYINNPSSRVSLFAIRKDVRTLHWIKKQTPKLCWAALKESGFALEYIRKPTQEMCQFAVEFSGHSIEYVPKKYITNELCISAVKNQGMALNDIKNPTEEMRLIAVKQDGWSFFSIENPSIEVLRVVAKNYKVMSTISSHDQYYDKLQGLI